MERRAFLRALLGTVAAPIVAIPFVGTSAVPASRRGFQVLDPNNRYTTAIAGAQIYCGDMVAMSGDVAFPLREPSDMLRLVGISAETSAVGEVFNILVQGFGHVRVGGKPGDEPTHKMVLRLG